jgi:hypothetical protein
MQLIAILLKPLKRPLLVELAGQHVEEFWSLWNICMYIVGMVGIAGRNRHGSPFDIQYIHK